jgi:hypothetical protein
MQNTVQNAWQCKNMQFCAIQGSQGSWIFPSYHPESISQYAKLTVHIRGSRFLDFFGLAKEDQSRNDVFIIFITKSGILARTCDGS